MAELIPDQHDSITAWWDAMDRAESEAEDRARLDAVLGTLDTLTDRDASVVRAYINGATMAAVADDHDISEGRVCQIWKRWLRDLGAADDDRVFGNRR